MHRMNPRAHGLKQWLPSWAIRERNSMAITLNIHTKSHTVRGRPTLKSHTVRGRPTLKLVECFGNGSVRELYERSIYK